MWQLILLHHRVYTIMYRAAINVILADNTIYYFAFKNHTDANLYIESNASCINET